MGRGRGRDTNGVRRALPWRSRRERLLALGRLWRLRLLGARRVLSMGPVHHVHLLLVKKEDKTMRHKMVLLLATSAEQDADNDTDHGAELDADKHVGIGADNGATQRCRQWFCQWCGQC